MKIRGTHDQRILCAACNYTMLAFDVLSDIHLELYNQEKELPTLETFLTPAGNYLALCGDIGDPFSDTYHRFIKACAERPTYKHVFIVLGNHEIWRSSCNEVASHLTAMCATLNRELGRHVLVFLNNNYHRLDNGVWVIGSTLWTKISDHERNDVKTFVADFRLIKDFQTVDDYNNMHHNCLERVIDLIESAKQSGAKAIVLSHHPPASICGDRKHLNSPLKSAYKNYLDSLIIQNPNVIAWFYGHDHFSMCKMLGSTMIASNQAGTPMEWALRQTPRQSTFFV